MASDRRRTRQAARFAALEENRAIASRAEAELARGEAPDLVEGRRLLELGRAASRIGDISLAQFFLFKAQDALVDHLDSLELLETLREYVHVENAFGMHAAAYRDCEAALLQTGSHPDRYAPVLEALAETYVGTGSYQAALGNLGEAMEYYAGLGMPADGARVLRRAGAVRHLIGQDAEAERDLRSA
ncbi:MAG: hypothetical protein M3340_19585, partial [Actinomycetota bacterium]|nr:hypothetical protein [Actinomycetota bacterium]